MGVGALTMLVFGTMTRREKAGTGRERKVEVSRKRKNKGIFVNL
jgi:hypothetical protein